MSSTDIAEVWTRASYRYSKIFKVSTFKSCLSSFLLRLDPHSAASLSARRTHINKKKNSKSHLIFSIRRRSSNARFLLVVWNLKPSHTHDSSSSSLLRLEPRNSASLFAHSSKIKKDRKIASCHHLARKKFQQRSVLFEAESWSTCRSTKDLLKGD